MYHPIIYLKKRLLYTTNICILKNGMTMNGGVYEDAENDLSFVNIELLIELHGCSYRIVLFEKISMTLFLD